MLSNIHIENIAVIKNIDVDLSDGFCAITGETGAGKTVIMDAIKLLVGAKCDRELIRRGEDRALVSGLFLDVPAFCVSALAELGYGCEDGELLVTRTFSSDGRSSVKLNGKSATAAIGRSIVSGLLDFHGQHDNVTLLDTKTHRHLLDEYAECAEELELYKAKYADFLDARKRLVSHLEGSRDKERELDFLRAQVKEIEAAKLKDGEEEQLERELQRLSNIEKIRKQSTFAYKALLGGERGNACMLIDKSAMALASVSDAVAEFEALSERLKAVYWELSNIAETVDSLCRVGEEEQLERE
ncbi:MAG: AAA family ATPase, partial [Clostridia bacterium]|nr:AAA family ATPase [Clostridia bacterium]